MSFLPSRVEAPVGTTLSLPLQVRGTVTLGNGKKSLEPFADCRRMSLTISSSKDSIFNVSVDTVTGEWWRVVESGGVLGLQLLCWALGAPTSLVGMLLARARNYYVIN